MTDPIFVPRVPFILGDVAVAMCASCGNQETLFEKKRMSPRGLETTEASLAPPPGWFEHQPSGALVCRNCSEASEFHLRFAREHEAFVEFVNETPYSYSTPRQRVRVVSRSKMLGSAPAERATHVLIDTGSVNKKEKAMKELVKEETAAAKPGVTTRLREHGGLLAGAAFDGAKLAAVNETGEVLLDIARKAFKDNPLIVGALSDPDGRQLVMAVMAIVLHEVAMEAPGLIPRADFVALAARKQLTATSFLVLHSKMGALRALIAEFGPSLARIADAGQELAGALPAESEPTNAADEPAATATAGARRRTA